MTDLLTGALAIPLHVVVERFWVDESVNVIFLNKAQIFFVYFATSGSTLNVCALSIDRYIAVKWPLRYPLIMTRRKLVVTIVFLWITNLSFSFPVIVIQSSKSLPFQLTRLFLLMTIPLVIMLYCYIKIFRISSKQLNHVCGVHPAFEMNGNGGNFIQRNSNVMKIRKASITLAIITVVFLLSFAPCFFLSIAVATVERCTFMSFIKKYWTWSIVLMYSSCAFNPLAYGARNTEIRVAIKRILRITHNN
jgi:RsiW-degrading membrane proteinase PrsW (M82 family)